MDAKAARAFVEHALEVGRIRRDEAEDWQQRLENERDAVVELAHREPNADVASANLWTPEEEARYEHRAVAQLKLRPDEVL